MALHMPATIDEIASMRYVVITLVLLNLVHLGWNLGWPLSEPDARSAQLFAEFRSYAGF